GSAGSDIGTLEFKGDGGADVTFHLVEGTNIRDHDNGVFVNTLSDATVATVEFDSGNVRLDRQQWDLPAAFATQTLVEVVFTGNDGTGALAAGDGVRFIAGLTVSTSTAPEPTSLGLLAIGLTCIAARRWRALRLRKQVA